MNVFFRTDASDTIGAGHLTRCLVLADAIAGQGGTCHFLVRHQNAVSRRLLDGRSYPVFSVDLPEDCDPSEDVRRCIGYARSVATAVDWLVVDHYGLDAQWERAARSLSSCILVIDDLADRAHDCDVLVDPGLGRQASEYARWVSAPTDMLLGSRYAILKPAFALNHGLAPLWSEVRRAHVFFGGGSAAEWMPECIDIMMDVEPDLEVSAVGMCSEQAMDRLMKRHGSRLKWVRQVDDMARHYATCSVALGSPGTATWERACIGLPSALLATAPNQVPILEGLDRLGLCRFLGPAWELKAPELRTRTRDFLQDDAARAVMRNCGLSAVDGRGVERLLRRLQGSGRSDV